MKVPFVDLHKQYLTLKDQIDDVIRKVITESAYIRGNYVAEFEENFSNLLKINNCVSCANGTDALYILMKGLKIKPGDEVITTAHSWISTSQTITQAGGKVVFCDTDKRSFNIDYKQIEDKITTKTVGIIPVHLYGQPAEMDVIMDIAKRNNLWVIEDCAQAHLAEFKGKKVGTFGNGAIFSFYPGKNLGAMGDAGCLVTNDRNLASWCRSFANHGGKGIHSMEGINSRLDGLQAAILSVKLPKLMEWTNSRQKIAQNYNQLLKTNDNIEVPFVDANRNHVFHLYVIKCSEREGLSKFLKKAEIQTSINYPKALPFYPAYSYLKHKKSDFPNAYSNQQKILSIPIYPELSEKMQFYIVDSINSFYK